MSKIAFVFPGQGAQYTGMAKDFYEKYAVSRKVFENASKASGLDVEALCFEENDRLNITEYTQIAMLTAEIAILRAVEEAGIRSQVNAGLSLGEYGALVASGVMKEEDAFTVVRKRGIFMQEAYPTGGAMSAVLGTDAELIEKICNETQGIVSIANYFSLKYFDTQIIMSKNSPRSHLWLQGVICHFYMIKPLHLCFSDNP